MGGSSAQGAHYCFTFLCWPLQLASVSLSSSPGPSGQPQSLQLDMLPTHKCATIWMLVYVITASLRVHSQQCGSSNAGPKVGIAHVVANLCMTCAASLPFHSGQAMRSMRRPAEGESSICTCCRESVVSHFCVGHCSHQGQQWCRSG